MKKKRNSLMGWLGRQVGYVKKAVVTPVPEVVYRNEKVEEARVEGRPEQKLRRTTIDEVIVEPGKTKNMGGTPMPHEKDMGGTPMPHEKDMGGTPMPHEKNMG